MSLKSVLIKSVLCTATLISINLKANATWQFGAGVGYGIGLIEFNGSRENSTFTGNTNSTDLTVNPNPTINAGTLQGLNAQAPAMRTTYKYVGNLPQRVFHIEGSAIKRYEDIRVMDRSFFAGVTVGLGYGKVKPSNGLTNPNGKYKDTGSSGIFWAINGKFGLENSGSKIYALTGLTSVKAHLPFDILPFGTNTALGDLMTCVVMQHGSTLLATAENATLNGIAITNIASWAQAACSQIKVDKNQHRLLFINIGAGTEVNVTPNITLFAEYTHMMQLNRERERTVNYTVNGVQGTFKGKIRATNTDYIKAGVRYYF
jgi:opacity protein-like surface antigen